MGGGLEGEGGPKVLIRTYSPSRFPNMSARVVPSVRFQSRFVVRRKVKSHLKKKVNFAFFAANQ